MHRPSLVFAGALWAIAGSWCQAQEDPFGAPAAPPPAAAPIEGKAAKSAKAGDAPVERPPLVIEMLRASNPTAANQLFQAAQIAYQYGRADEAKLYLAKLIAAKPADDALVPLSAQGDFVVQLNAATELQPEGRQVAALIVTASHRALQNAEALAAKVRDLSSTNESIRYQALRSLVTAGSAAINPLLEAMADESRASEHPQARTALVAIGQGAELPVIAVLQDSKVRDQAIAVLGRMRSQRSVIHLVPFLFDQSLPSHVRELAAVAVKKIEGNVPDLTEAKRSLREQIERYLKGEFDRPVSLNDTVSRWSWDGRRVESTEMSRPLAGAAFAADLARALYRLQPNDLSLRRLTVLTKLQHVKLSSGLERELNIQNVNTPEVSITPGDVTYVLADAMQRGHVPAAIAAAELLGHMKDTSVLHVHGGGGGPLVDALKHSDRRVRLAAALSAVKLDPGGSFEGAGLVAPTLGGFIKSSGKPTVLIGHPRGEEAQAIATYATPLGYAADAVYSGRLLAERAFQSPDVELLLISDAIEAPPVEELVQWLRRDYRTARIPIGVLARSERLEMLTEFFKHDPFTAVVSRIHSAEVTAIVIRRLEAIAGANRIGGEEKRQQAELALAALNALATCDKTIARYDLLRQEPAAASAIQQPTLSAGAAELLAHLGTPTAQAALLDFASQSNRPLEARQVAAAAFVSAVKRRGLRLTQNQILNQYNRYNASAPLDPATQVLLGEILDAIEAQPAGSE